MKLKRLLSLVLFVAIMISMIALVNGCSKDNDKSSESDQKQEIIELSLFYSNFAVNPDSKLNEKIAKIIEEDIGIKINWINPPWNSYREKLNLAISTGDLADIMIHYGPMGTTYLNWVNEGMFLELDEYLENAPNIKKVIPDDLLEQMRTNGKIYFIPRLFMPMSHVMFYRQDWLDKLGLEVPNTTDEFYEVAKALKDDPDGNGKNDTYAFGSFGAGGLYWIRQFSTAFDAPWNEIKKYDGEWKYASAVPQTKQFVAYVKKLYDEGLLDPEFTVVKNTVEKEKFFQGKLGFLGMPYADYFKAKDSLAKVDPTAVVAYMAPPVGPNGKGGWQVYSKGDVSYYTGASVSKDSKNPEAAVRFMDYVLSEKGSVLGFYGLEDEHYKVEDGKYIRLQSQDELATQAIGLCSPLNFLITDVKYAESLNPDTDIEAALREVASARYYRDFLLNKPMTTRIAELWADLSSFANEQLILFMVGQRPLDEFDSYIKEWHDRGGTELLDLITKEMAKIE